MKREENKKGQQYNKEAVKAPLSQQGQQQQQHKHIEKKESDLSCRKGAEGSCETHGAKHQANKPHNPNFQNKQK
jgi:hypothetical protein